MACVAALALTPVAARAETRTTPDRTGDAPARIDIERARYDYGEGRVSVVARIPLLGDSGEASLSVSRYTIFEAGYVVRIIKRPNRAARTGLYFFNHFELVKRRCPQVSGEWGTGSIKLAVPVACLEDHRTPRVFVQFGIGADGSIDRAPAVRRLARD
jgi:hypothetical protein